jgi:hypothetical protein
VQATLAGLGNQTSMFICLSADSPCTNARTAVAIPHRTEQGSRGADDLRHAIPASAIKNGNLTFTTNPATLTAAATVSGAVAVAQQ